MSSDYSASYTRLSQPTTEEQITTKNYVDQNAKNEEIEKPGSTVTGHSSCPRLVESEETLLYCCLFLFMSKEQQREKVVSCCHCQAIIWILKIIGQLIKRKTNSPNPTTKLHTTSLMIPIETLEVTFIYKVMKESKIL